MLFIIRVHVACHGDLCMCVLFYFYSGCLHGHCGSALGLGASGLSYYCTPPMCISDVIGGLAVWRHNQKKTKKSPRGTVLENLAAHHLCAFLVYHDSRATMIRGLAVRRNNKPKTKNQLKKQGWVGLNKHAYSVKISVTGSIRKLSLLFFQ